MKTHETVGHKELIKAHKLVEGITLESYDEFVSLFSDVCYSVFLFVCFIFYFIL